MQKQPLLIFFPPGQDRRIKVIQNILTGKSRTVATLFWGMQYQLLSYFKVFTRLPKDFSSVALQECLENKLLRSHGRYQYQLSTIADQNYRVLKQLYQLKFNTQSSLAFDIDRFAQRFYLANQVISEYSYHQTHYYPLKIDYRDQLAVKNWFHHYKSSQLVHTWFNCLTAFLGTLPTNELAWQFASSLVGNDRVGLTLNQQAYQLHLPDSIIALRKRMLLNQLLVKLLSFNLPVINDLFLDLKGSFVSNSALLTVKDWHRGLSLNQIANKRNLKVSTVKEHLEEAAIFMSWQRFPFRNLITDQHFKLFERSLSGSVAQWNFQSLLTYDQKLDYFEFRLYQILRSKIHD